MASWPRVVDRPTQATDGTAAPRKARHYKYKEVIQLALGRKRDEMMERHVLNCPVCWAHAKNADEIKLLAKKAMEET